MTTQQHVLFIEHACNTLTLPWLEFEPLAGWLGVLTVIFTHQNVQMKKQFKEEQIIGTVRETDRAGCKFDVA
jgi:hypothetical protein